MAFVLPQLAYQYNALEPYIDALTMEIHYTKHHQAYVNGLNAALEKYPELQKKSLEDLLSNLTSIPADIRVAVQNNGGGHYNHSLFWLLMKKGGGGIPHGTVAQEIDKVFGSFQQFKQQFTIAAKSRFGSGWAWLSINKGGDLVLTSSANQDSPLSEGLRPIMGLDVWEHAYYLQYQNRRPDYINAWWSVVDWERVEDIYKEL
jgi:superoxide dismutase, Fe-Mn family